MPPTLGGGAVCRRATASSSSFERKLVSRAFSQLAITPSLPNKASSLLRSPGICWGFPTCDLRRRRLLPTTTQRNAGSASSSQWKARQSRDQYARIAKVQGLKSRAAFKLLEIDQRYRIFKRNQVIVDLGYAPGSWSQVALERTKPRGIVVGIDLIPAQPPRGVTSIQGDFLSPQVRKLVKDVLLEQVRRKRRESMEKKRLKQEKAEAAMQEESETETEREVEREGEQDENETGGRKQEAEQVTDKGEEALILEDRPSYIDMEKLASQDIEAAEAEEEKNGMVDIVLSDMSEPWPQTTGFMSNTLSNPYRRLMNTSGNAFRDHAGSMDLCHAALQFASDNLKWRGHFICKFYMGNEAKAFEAKLRRMFKHVHRQKPDSSRKDSKEEFFVALSRKANVTLADIEGE